MKGPPRFIDLVQDRNAPPAAATRDDPRRWNPSRRRWRGSISPNSISNSTPPSASCSAASPTRRPMPERRMCCARGRRCSGWCAASSAASREQEPPVRFLVLASRAPGVWNLGADLKLFAELIRSRDRANLWRYAHSCCGFAFANATGLGFDLPVVSVALIQGDALGAGFELALSSNLIVAERSAKFGLPEILFNLFPGMGAVSFLSRRIPAGPGRAADPERRDLWRRATARAGRRRRAGPGRAGRRRPP